MKSEFEQWMDELTMPKERSYSSWWLVLAGVAVAAACYVALARQGIRL